METVFKKSFKEFYAFIILVLLSLLTIAADYRYNQLNYVRSLINDTVIYPIDYLSTMPKQILEASVEESQIKSEMESKIKLLEEENLRLRIQLQEYQALKDENLRLRKMSEASTKISEKQLIVRLGKFPFDTAVVKVLLFIFVLESSLNTTTPSFLN